MKISTILDHIDSGHMALPELQRGYDGTRDQVRGLLVWAIETTSATSSGDGHRSVKLGESS